MNKYKQFSRQAAKAYRKHRACDRKVGFDSEEEAAQKGMTTYRCGYCHKWHRASITWKVV